MNKHFNINYADQESDWKDLTIVNLLSEISDLEDKIDKAIEYIESFDTINIDRELLIECIDKTLNILKGSDKE